MKITQNFTKLGFVAFLLFGLSHVVQAQTSSVTVTNNTSASMYITIVGSTLMPTNPNCIAGAHANGTVAAGATATFNFVDNSTGLPTSAVLFGMSAQATGVPGSTLAWVDDCRITSQTGASTATGPYNCSVTQGSSSQTATVN